MSRAEIRITGFGGQGVVLCGYIIGRSCAVHGGMHATLMQSFGPEARGSSCSATLAISDAEVLYPYIQRPDYLVAMSDDGYQTYRDELKPGGMLIFERDLVHPKLRDGQPAYGVPSTRIAESLGRAIIQNIVMLGFFGAAAGLVTKEAMRAAVKGSVPAGTEELNLGAFEAGWSYFERECGAPRPERPTAEHASSEARGEASRGKRG